VGMEERQGRIPTLARSAPSVPVPHSVFGPLESQATPESTVTNTRERDIKGVLNFSGMRTSDVHEQLLDSSHSQYQ
jgi:hypothetical protein